MKKLLKNKNGITLIALVITIIVLLILAGVSIATLTGENGILTQAEDAKDKTTEAEAIERVQVEVAGSYGTDGEVDIDQLNKNLKNINGLTYEGNALSESNKIESLPATVTLNGYDIKIEASGKTSKVTKGEGISAKEISEKATEYYGEEVTGYTCESTGVSKWRIFHSDGTNIYLIADDYIASSAAPNSAGGKTIYDNRNCKLSFDNIVSDTTYSSDWISNNSKAKNWLNKYLKYLTDNSSGNITSNDIRATAYMMDTNIWGVYAGEKASWAIGSPTLELFAESYSKTHSDKGIDTTVESTKGYKVKWSTDSSYSTYINGMPTTDEFNSIYVKTATSNASAVWLASPAAGGTNYLFYANYDGGLNYYIYSYGHPGLRPVVCLNSGVNLELKSEGVYSVIQ